MDVDLTRQALLEHEVDLPVVVCRDGEEALDYMRAHVVDDAHLPALVLLDLRLPGVDGLEVLRHARADGVWRRVPIVVLTTSRETCDVDEAYRIGANSYLVKPLDLDSFSAMIDLLNRYWLLANEPPFRERRGI